MVYTGLRWRRACRLHGSACRMPWQMIGSAADQVLCGTGMHVLMGRPAAAQVKDDKGPS